jgi:hypothetical protein|nr:MAG TPA: hypothetical protein [Caudoviricetes sp.]
MTASDFSSAGSLFLDMQDARKSHSASDSITRWVKGQVVDTPDTDPTLPAGWVRVGMPYNEPDTYVTGETPGLYTWKGAMVTVKMHSDGTLLSISDGQDEPGDERTQVERLGPAGREIAGAMSDAVKAQKAAEEIRGRADVAAKDAAAAQRAALGAKVAADAAMQKATTVEGQASGLDGKITAAQKAADEAKAAVAGADSKATAAQDKAQAALDAVKKSGDNAAALAAATEAKQAADAAKTLAQQARTAAQQAQASVADAAQKATKAQTLAEKADATAAAVKSTAESADAAAKKAASDAAAAQASYKSLQATVSANSADLAAAKSKADQATKDAVAAKDAASKATADALGARQAADAASSKASTLAGQVTVSPSVPVSADGQGKPKGAVWFVQNGQGVLTSQYAWDGAKWSLMPVDGSVIKDATITSAKIGNAAIGSAQIADAAITDAKIGGLSVSKLLVTGGAKIPRAVIDQLASDEAFIGKLSANSVTVDPENMLRDPGFTGSPSGVWSPSVPAGGSVAFVSDIEGAPGGRSTGGRLVGGTASEAQLNQQFKIPAGKVWVLRLTYRYLQGSAGGLQLKAGGTALPAFPYKDAGWHTEDVDWSPASSVTGGVCQVCAGKGTKAEVAAIVLCQKVGATMLAPGSVTSDAIYASKELWAKVSAFGSVTTEMLTAGKATITGDAVVGNLKGNNIFGSKIVGSSMYAYSESAESLNKKGLPYKSVDADGGDWVSQAIPMTRAWANRYGANDSDGVCTITSASDSEMTGKYTSRLDFTYNACWETYVDLPDGDVFDPSLDFWCADVGGTTEMEIVLLRDGVELSRNRTLDGWQTLSIANWKKGDAGTRRYYLRIFPLYSPTNVSFKDLKLWYRTVYDTSSIRLKGNSLLFRQSVPDDKGTNSWFRFAGGQMYASGTNRLEYQRPLKSLVMPPHFIGTTNQQRILQRNYWEWWPGKLQNDTEWFEYDAQDFRIGKNNIPQASYSGLYWVTIQVTASSHYSSLWTTLLVELNPAGNWDLAVGNSITLEPGVKGVKVSAAGLMQLRTNVRLYWHFAIRTPDMGSENGTVEINNMRLSAMYISN